MAIQLSKEQIVSAARAGMELLTGQANARKILRIMPDLIVLRTLLNSVVSGEAMVIPVKRPKEKEPVPVPEAAPDNGKLLQKLDEA